MKITTAYYLLLIYLFALCKPVLPLVQDVIAHTLFEHQHIESVHISAGKNHVTNEVGKLSNEDNSNGSGTPRSYDDATLHLPVILQFSICTSRHILVHNSYSPSYFFPIVPLAIQLPPPKA